MMVVTGASFDLAELYLPSGKLKALMHMLLPYDGSLISPVGAPTPSSSSEPASETQPGRDEYSLPMVDFRTGW